jgi:hypothetical protein
MKDKKDQMDEQFLQYPQELEDAIGALSEYLFGKYNDIFDAFYLAECDEHANG